jgi:hypothetical protein
MVKGGVSPSLDPWAWEIFLILILPLVVVIFVIIISILFWGETCVVFIQELSDILPMSIGQRKADVSRSLHE